jgi:hypothetical protein
MPPLGISCKSWQTSNHWTHINKFKSICLVQSPNSSPTWEVSSIGLESSEKYPHIDD